MPIQPTEPVFGAVEHDPQLHHAAEVPVSDAIEQQITESATLDEAVATLIYGRLQTTFLESSQDMRDPNADYSRWQDITIRLKDEDFVAAHTEQQLLTVLEHALRHSPAGRAALLLPRGSNLATAATTIWKDFLEISVESSTGKKPRDEIIDLYAVFQSFEVILTAQNDPLIQLYTYIEQRFGAILHPRQLAGLKRDLILGGKHLAVRNIYMKAIHLERTWESQT
jgi:hypothetical protein